MGRKKRPREGQRYGDRVNRLIISEHAIARVMEDITIGRDEAIRVIRESVSQARYVRHSLFQQGSTWKTNTWYFCIKPAELPGEEGKDILLTAMRRDAIRRM